MRPRNRDVIRLGIIAILLSFGMSGCGKIGENKEVISTESVATVQPEGIEISENGAVWDLFENLESEDCVIAGKRETTDYPYGFNVGLIEDEEVGKAFLLTPGTSISILGISTGEYFLNIKYLIHPWVAENSDGIILLIDITADEVTEIYSYEIDGKTATQSISLEDYKGKQIKIDLHLENKDGLNENCDWLIIKECYVGEKETQKSNFGSEGYVKSATYFADEWPINFWNSEMDYLDEDMARIKSDGFNSIILVIPWREFQPQVAPVSYNEYAFEKLDEVMRAAERADLEVYARIGYTWDFYEDEKEDIVNRFCNLLGDKSTQEAWRDYATKLYENLSKYENFKEAFLTWEDFWNTLGVCDEVFESTRKDKADFIGYQSWVEQNYSLQQYNERFGTSYKEYSSIPVPKRDEPAMEAMYEFYDDFLNRILKQTQEVFTNISMEVRMDWDVVYKTDGEKDYYKHTKTFGCMDSDYTATMYGIPMGFENNGEQVSYIEAMEKTDYILNLLKLQNGNKPVYIEQFIFADNTPKFVNNARIKEEELNNYLENVADILLKNSEGYGIWTYRNYRANMLYNSQFALEDMGWEMNGEVDFEEVKDSFACHLEPGEGIRQKISKIRNHFDANEYTIELDIVKVNKAGTLTVKVGNKRESIEIAEEGSISLTFPKTLSFDIDIKAQGCDVFIDNIRLYSQIQQGYLYDENNNELICIDGIRVLNSELH